MLVKLNRDDIHCMGGICSIVLKWLSSPILDHRYIKIAQILLTNNQTNFDETWQFWSMLKWSPHSHKCWRNFHGYGPLVKRFQHVMGLFWCICSNNFTYQCILNLYGIVQVSYIGPSWPLVLIHAKRNIKHDFKQYSHTYYMYLYVYFHGVSHPYRQWAKRSNDLEIWVSVILN